MCTTLRPDHSMEVRGQWPLSTRDITRFLEVSGDDKTRTRVLSQISCAGPADHEALVQPVVNRVLATYAS